MTARQQPDVTLREPGYFPTDPAHVLLRGPCGHIEALIDHPEGEAIDVTAVVCSPAEAIGTMHSKVVHIIERSFRELGASTVRFNFRGVGASDGEPASGFGETEDLLAVVAWLQDVRPGCELWLGGYGLGSFVATRACQKLPVSQLVTVAPPINAFDFEALPTPACPWLIVQGDTDDHVLPEAVYSWAEGLEPKPQLVKMKEADHAFHRRLLDLRGAIKNGIRRNLRQSEPGAR